MDKEMEREGKERERSSRVGGREIQRISFNRGAEDLEQGEGLGARRERDHSRKADRERKGTQQI